MLVGATDFPFPVSLWCNVGKAIQSNASANANANANARLGQTREQGEKMADESVETMYRRQKKQNMN